MNEQILDALRGISHPGLDRDLVSLGMVKKAAIDGDQVNILIELRPRGALRAPLRRNRGSGPRGPSRQAGVCGLDSRPSRAAELWLKNYPSLERVQHIILVASGKGE